MESHNQSNNTNYNRLNDAKEHISDVKILDIKKKDGDEFLTNPTLFPNLEILKVHFSELSEISSLNALTNIKQIKIMYSWSLVKLPRDFTLLPELNEISIYSCGLKSLPETFFENKNLARVTICKNALLELPKIPIENSIKFLNLSLNKFKELPDDFVNLKNIEALNIRDCEFSSFPAQILELKNLKKLDLSANDIQFLPTKLGEMPNLEVLYLVNTKITTLPKSLKNSKLSLVRMSDENLSEEEKKLIKNSLPKDCQIVWTSKINYSISEINDGECFNSKYLY